MFLEGGHLTGTLRRLQPYARGTALVDDQPDILCGRRSRATVRFARQARHMNHPCDPAHSIERTYPHSIGVASGNRPSRVVPSWRQPRRRVAARAHRGCRPAGAGADVRGDDVLDSDVSLAAAARADRSDALSYRVPGRRHRVCRPVHSSGACRRPPPSVPGGAAGRAALHGDVRHHRDGARARPDRRARLDGHLRVGICRHVDLEAALAGADRDFGGRRRRCGRGPARHHVGTGVAPGAYWHARPFDRPRAPAADCAPAWRAGQHVQLRVCGRS